MGGSQEPFRAVIRAILCSIKHATASCLLTATSSNCGDILKPLNLIHKRNLMKAQSRNLGIRQILMDTNKWVSTQPSYWQPSNAVQRLNVDGSATTDSSYSLSLSSDRRYHCLRIAIKRWASTRTVYFLYCFMFTARYLLKKYIKV